MISITKEAVPVLSVRPKVAELVFQVYGRPLHPELFEFRQSREIDRGDYAVKVDITTAGHIVTWRHPTGTLTEVASAAHHPMPEKRRLFRHTLQQSRSESVECRCGATYQVSFQLEIAEPEVFWFFQEDLAEDSEREGLFHRFDSGGRIALGAISYVNIETRSRQLLVQAFHTFPEDYAIVKSQSIFQLP